MRLPQLLLSYLRSVDAAMSDHLSVLLITPQGLPGIGAHHEATSGMGALDPAPRPFLYPPHLLATATTALRAAGMDATVMDASGNSAARLPLDAVLNEIARHPADVLAVHVSHGTALADENFLRLLRWRCGGRKILLFGSSAHFVVKPWLAAGLADAALLGEPEAALAQTVAAAAGGATGAIAAADTSAPDRYDETGLLRDLDTVPFPAWDAVSLSAYGHRASLLSSRGCPAGCRFCAYVVAQGRKVRCQSIERTLAEWEWLAREVRPTYLYLRDPVFAYDRARVEAICSGIIDRGLELPWGCESRPEHFDRELLKLLKAAGCGDIKIGMESGDAAMLRALGRLPEADTADAYLAQVHGVADTCQQLGLTCRIFVMVGLPGQDGASLAATRTQLRRLAPAAIVHVHAYQAHPNTALPGPSASVLDETIQSLQRSNQSAPNALQRARAVFASAWRTAQTGAPAGNTTHPSTPLRPAQEASESKDAPFTWAGRTVFLTGGNGFIGGYIARALAAAGAHVIALVRPGSPLGALAELPRDSVEIVSGDLTDAYAGWTTALAGCEFCFHVAAHYGGPAQADAMVAVNVTGTSMLLEACARAGVRRVVYTGTIGTVGQPPTARVLPDEDTPFNLWNSASHYVRSKYLGERAACGWAEAGLEVVIVKPAAPVGAGDARPTATGARILAALEQRSTSYPPGGISFAPVQDIAVGHLLAAERGLRGRTYILGHRDGNLTEAAFHKMLARVAGTVPIRPAPKRGEAAQPPLALTADPSRAIQELGLPQSDLTAAFAEAVAWYRARNGAAT